MEEKDAKTVWHCPYWRVETRKFRSGDGEEHIWYSAKRPNPETVHILGLTNDGLVPVIRQWRYPLEAPVWELPAGLCDIEGEAMTQTALRELEEETGYRGQQVLHLMRGTVTPGLSDEMYNAFLALGLEKVSAGGGTASEDIEVELVPFAELFDTMLARSRAGELVDSKIFSHIGLAVHMLGELNSQLDRMERGQQDD
ncbi:NUDIX hydrolase [bacterium]|nr:NUDIX hydrolase [bacterium]MCB1221047.1 NUDIX hydrolase [bacterium]UNM08505.1 MAG: NUDIX hydrolase [Planctomycetales bacterium]